MKQKSKILFEIQRDIRESKELDKKISVFISSKFEEKTFEEGIQTKFIADEIRKATKGKRILLENKL